MSAVNINDLVVLGQDLFVTKLYCAAIITVVIYDFLLTLQDEIMFIWKTKKTWVSFVFLFSRYFSVACCIIISIPYFSPRFTAKMCDRWAVFQLVQAAMALSASQVLMMLRVYAMSGRNKCILISLSIIASGNSIFILVLAMLPGNKGIPLPNIDLEVYRLCYLSPVCKTCDLIVIAVSLSFDVAVFILTLIYSVRTARSSKPSHLLRALVLDGVMYFFFVFSSNLLWLLLIKYARVGLKFVQEEPNILLTPMIINRLMLALHKASHKDAQPGITWDGHSRTVTTTYESHGMMTFTALDMPQTSLEEF